MNSANPKDLAELALNAACLAIQERLGVESGDVASLFFSGSEESAVLEIFTRYAATEIAFGADQREASGKGNAHQAPVMLWPYRAKANSEAAEKPKGIWPNRRQWARLVLIDLAILAAFFAALFAHIGKAPDDSATMDLISERTGL